MMLRLKTPVADERGAVMTLVAVSLLALVLMVAFVVDVANWKIHKRHLQLQVDAAALAAAGAYSFTTCPSAAVKAAAHRYGGPDASAAAALYNGQVGGTPASKMHLYINSAGYYGDTTYGDDTDTAACSGRYIDIKGTESDLPWFLGFGGIVSRINAHARVAVLQQGSSSSTLPIAVPNPKPTIAGAIFINEANGNVVGTVPLHDAGASGSLQMYGSDPGTWADISQLPAHTGVVIALSGRPTASFSLAGDLATICSQALTDCYDGSTDPPTYGLSYIRGFNPNIGGAQPLPPQLRTVELLAGACPNTAYFSNNTTGCVYDIYARIDKGPLANAAVIFKANGAQLFSSNDPACDNLDQTGVGTCWHAQLTLPAGSGPNNITMTWEETTGCLDAPCGQKGATQCTSNNNNKCKGNFENGVPVQRAFSAVDAATGHNSGPIKVLRVFKCQGDATCAQPDKQSFPVDSPQKFAVSIGIAGLLRNATGVNDPLVVLRVKSQTGQSLDCDPLYQNLKTEMWKGCRPLYEPNTGSPDCSVTKTTVLWAMQQPWHCIAVSTGRQPNDISGGLNARLYHGDDQPNTCPPDGTNGHNNWHMFDPTDAAGDGTYGFPPGDPRVLDAYLTTYGAFSHVNGTSGSVPVTGFGHFYVTGYTGNGGGFNNPCYPGPPSNYHGPHPDDRTPNDDTGLIVGHFIFYLNKLGGDNGQPCDPSSINACVIVMTK
jgi:Putative Flp pilus-assembly TadE/G-like